ncbi:branched-chain amino acid ABC transporter permease [Sulfitobacter sp. KE34]|uniref:Branched-chain amino acid ABC transporter permease n=1 Tax=Sulfitobacter faviae TaxID=1775881 RepID=A0AAX3LTR4_9RHOB|nr:MULTISPECIES: branched-chain amino acid ABC transporter permease [Sulfitobacter]MDF3350541.1 branched-chain amino acid ABC transporter permease [Sulfitobacter sp. KE12]MDF3354256.1 branched-chain amino acid ABC transporter permease [Sulfitobacter sp. KE27]MDF3357861.1 branched-chain amino acid ABC transporter permease [Sulfitobacter sp. KE33]MDF3359985.1 branched-chain amino acid ABC transporter permease [Sulfitobacter sp. Ks41]MDF3365328.1 branched-chain amino acid ABC transporter permease
MMRETLVNVFLFLLLPVTALAAFALDEPFIITLATKAAILALAGVGLNIALGLGGLVSFGHAAFFGLGGYAMGILAAHAQSYTPIMESPFLIEGTKSMPIIWLVAIVVSALAALLIGALSLRTSGVYFIMVTLAFGQMLFYFSISWPAYGGEDGLSIYVRNGFPGLNTLNPLTFFAIAFAVLALVLLFAGRLARAPFGLALSAARQNAERVESVGLAPFRLRLVAFVISGAVTGLAGALFADLNRFVSPTMFSWQTSGEIMIFVILGGVGRLFGPVAGAALFILLEHVLGGLSEFWHIYLGFLLLMVVLFARGGMIGLIAGREVAHD